MAQEKQKAMWLPFSDLMALIANVNRQDGTPAYSPEAFNRTVRQKKKKKKGTIKALRVFLPESKRNELRERDRCQATAEQ